MSKIPYNKEDLADHHGVAAIIKDKDSKILVQEHIKYGFWTIPVGKVKEGQDIVDGLRQEILEECNINIINTKEIKVRDFYY
ncbi:MAG: NUDIX domain-containing protein, partial [Candidatus Paceibacterota bacterium]